MRLASLSGHCLTNLGSGLTAMTRGDLTVAVQPVTTPLESRGGRQAGELVAIFNECWRRRRAASRPTTRCACSSPR